MSADNGIYVLQTRKAVSCGYIEYEYRIAHTQAIDNFDYYEKISTKKLKEYMVDIWGNSKVYGNRRDALQAAHELADGYEILEYGVRVIKTNYIFPEKVSTE